MVDRNVYSLLDLTPGVQSNNNGVASASVTTSSLVLGFPEQRTLINGGADGGTGSVNYYLDGGINMTALRNTGNILPNPDAIQEFKVQTNSLQRRVRAFLERHHQRHHQGRHQRAISGSAFEYLPQRQHEREGVGLACWTTPPLKRNQFGGTLGGPIAREQDLLLRHLLRAAPDHAARS